MCNFFNKYLLYLRHALIFINKNKEFSEVTFAALCEHCKYFANKI